MGTGGNEKKLWACHPFYMNIGIKIDKLGKYM